MHGLAGEIRTRGFHKWVEEVSDLVKIKLTDVGKEFMKEHYPEGIVYEYNPEGTFELKGVAAEFVEFICPMGIPYRMPHKVGEEKTWTKAE